MTVLRKKKRDEGSAELVHQQPVQDACLLGMVRQVKSNVMMFWPKDFGRVRVSDRAATEIQILDLWSALCSHELVDIWNFFEAAAVCGHDLSGQVLSEYRSSDGRTLWIVTDEVRQQTTIVLPMEVGADE